MLWACRSMQSQFHTCTLYVVKCDLSCLYMYTKDMIATDTSTNLGVVTLAIMYIYTMHTHIPTHTQLSTACPTPVGSEGISKAGQTCREVHPVCLQRTKANLNETLHSKEQKRLIHTHTTSVHVSHTHLPPNLPLYMHTHPPPTLSSHTPPTIPSSPPDSEYPPGLRPPPPAQHPGVTGTDCKTTTSSVWDETQAHHPRLCCEEAACDRSGRNTLQHFVEN